MCQSFRFITRTESCETSLWKNNVSGQGRVPVLILQVTPVEPESGFEVRTVTVYRDHLSTLSYSLWVKVTKEALNRNMVSPSFILSSAVVFLFPERKNDMYVVSTNCTYVRSPPNPESIIGLLIFFGGALKIRAWPVILAWYLIRQEIFRRFQNWRHFCQYGARFRRYWRLRIYSGFLGIVVKVGFSLVAGFPNVRSKYSSDLGYNVIVLLVRLQLVALSSYYSS